MRLGSHFDRRVRRVGSDPDPRFTLANERTYLAWLTLALGLLGIGLAVGTVLPGSSHAALRMLAVAWIALSVGVLVRAVRRWYVLEQAMRRGEGLPLSRSIPYVAIAVGVLAALTAIALVAA
jgi:putative membrane protein